MKTYHYVYVCTVITLVATLHLNMYAITETENRLMGAIHSGDTSDTLEILKTQKLDVNVKGPGDHTPLDWAIYRQDPDIVLLLINYGLKLPTNLQLDQPSENEAMQLLQDYARMLLQARNRPTKALLDKAVKSGYVPVVKLLLEKGIQVNPGDLKQVNDLYIIKQDTYKLIRALLAKHLIPYSEAPGQEAKITGDTQPEDTQKDIPGYAQD